MRQAQALPFLLVTVFVEKRIVVLASAIAAASLAGYALATHGWMLYPLLVLQAVSGVGAVAAQSWISQAIDRHEHGRPRAVFGDAWWTDARVCRGR